MMRVCEDAVRVPVRHDAPGAFRRGAGLGVYNVRFVRVQSGLGNCVAGEDNWRLIVFFSGMRDDACVHGWHGPGA
jgi:hypothetical protein